MYIPYEIISIIQEFILDKKTMLNILLTRKEYYHKLIEKFYELVIFDKEEYDCNNSKYKKNIYCSCKEVNKYEDARNRYIYCGCNLIEICEKKCSKNLPYRINNMNIPNNNLLDVIKKFKYFKPINKKNIVRLEYINKLEYLKLKNEIDICSDKLPQKLETIVFKWHDQLYKNIIISKIKKDIPYEEKNKILYIDEYTDVGTSTPYTRIELLNITYEDQLIMDVMEGNYEYSDVYKSDESDESDSSDEVLKV